MLATLAVFGGLVAWDNLVARGVFSRGVLLATLLFALVLPPLAETGARAVLIRRGRWGIPVVMLGAGDTGPRAGAHSDCVSRNSGCKPIAFLDNRADDVEHRGRRNSGDRVHWVWRPISSGARKPRLFACADLERGRRRVGCCRN